MTDIDPIAAGASEEVTPVAADAPEGEQDDDKTTPEVPADEQADQGDQAGTE
jgi:hypothetical protein